MPKLQTCVQCNTSYDVTEMTNGAQFRCSCGELVTVSTQISNEDAANGAPGDGNTGCPGCGTVYDTSAMGMGARFTCSNCQTEITVADLPEEDLSLPDGENIGLDSGVVETSTGGAGTAATVETGARLACPTCKTVFDITGMQSGQRFTCNKCTSMITVGAGASAKAPLRPPSDLEVASADTRLGDSGGSRLNTPKGKMRCHKCTQLFGTARLQPGNRFRCPKCGEILTVPGGPPQAIATASSVGLPQQRAPQQQPPQNAPVTTLANSAIINCDRCDTPYDISDLKPAQRFKCTECDTILTVPGKRGSTRIRSLQKKAKKRKSSAVLPSAHGGVNENDGLAVLNCKKCDMEFDITDLAPGQRFKCDGCGAVNTVPRRRKGRSSRSTGSFSKSKATKNSLACQGCGTTYDVSSLGSKQAFQCPTCKHMVVVP